MGVWARVPIDLAGVPPLAAWSKLSVCLSVPPTPRTSRPGWPLLQGGAWTHLRVKWTPVPGSQYPLEGLRDT